MLEIACFKKLAVAKRPHQISRISFQPFSRYEIRA